MELPEVSCIAGIAPGRRLLRLVPSWDLARCFLSPSWGEETKKRWIVESPGDWQRSDQVIVSRCLCLALFSKIDDSLNVFCSYYCNNKDCFLRRVVLGLVAIPSIFPCQVSSLTLEMSHVRNVSFVISPRQDHLKIEVGKTLPVSSGIWLLL